VKRQDDDGAILAACRAGDAAAWETLIRRYRRLIYSVPAAYRLPTDQADEVFQRVTIKLFEHMGRLRSAETLPTWLLVTTRRESQEMSRKEKRYAPFDDEDSERLPAEDSDVAGRIDAVAREHEVALALERMGSPCRELLTALYVEEPTPPYDEIARRLGRPIGSLGPTRSRCLDKLKSLYLESGINRAPAPSPGVTGRRGPRGS
jgi:RNA polymerase sigma factor (sigma-70 family)